MCDGQCALSSAASWVVGPAHILLVTTGCGEDADADNEIVGEDPEVEFSLWRI